VVLKRGKTSGTYTKKKVDFIAATKSDRHQNGLFEGNGVGLYYVRPSVCLTAGLHVIKAATTEWI
jgi:hypothetical protein